MIHAYQKGYIKQPEGKAKDMAADIKPTTVTHFAKTKHKGLRNKVKKAGIDWAGRLTRLKLRKDPEMKHDDLTEDKNLIKKMIKPEALKKDAFARGFMKAAMSAGLDPITSANLFKKADAHSDAMLNRLMASGVTQGAIGAGVGGLAGAGLGYFSGKDKDPSKDHSTRNALLGGLAGAGIGGVGGGYNGANQAWMNDVIDPEVNKLEAFKNSWIGKMNGAINPQQGADIDNNIKLMKNTSLFKALLGGIP